MALAAAAELEKDNIQAEVIDLMTVRPIDYAAVVDSVKKTNRLVIVEEAWPLAAISSEVTYHIQKYAFDYLDAPVARVGAPFSPVPFSPALEAHYVPNAERIVAEARKMLGV